MKILNVMLLPWKAGTENAFLNYSNALLYNGCEVYNLVHPESEILPILSQTKAINIKTKFIGRFGKHDPFTIFYFSKLIKNIKPDVIIAHQGRMVLLLSMAKGKVPLIAVNHGYNVKHCKKADLTIAINEITKQQTTGRVAKIRNCLPGNFTYKERKFHKSITIGSFARFSPEKGFDLLIRAFALLKQEIESLKLIIGGYGPEEDNLQNLVKTLNVQDVSFVGAISNKEEFFDKIDIFIIPSRFEQGPITLIESFAHSVPVVASKTYGPLEMVKNKENGILFEIENIQDMVDKIRLVINDEPFARKLAENAFADFQKNYTESTFRQNLQSTIESFKEHKT